MSPKSLGLCALLSLVSASAFAQTTTPTAWECQADCFSFGGNDGASLFYDGRVTTPLFFDEQKAFDTLQSYCDEGVLVVRTLKGTTSETTIDQHWDENSQYSTREDWYGLRVVHSSQQSTQYQVINHQLRGIFDVQTATPANSCKVKPVWSFPVRFTPNGDVIQG